MTTSEKVTFVNQLVDTVKADIISAITDGRVPDDWDGFELRRLLADRFESEAFKLAPARQKAYRNVVLTNRLT